MLPGDLLLQCKIQFDYIKIETISDQYLIPFIVNAISGLQKYFVNKVVDAHTQAS